MMNKEDLELLGYDQVRQLPSGQWAGLRKMFFTTGLFVGLDELGYSHRYCYQHFGDAAEALKHWDGNGDPPGMWIVRKGRDGDRQGPGSKVTLVRDSEVK